MADYVSIFENGSTVDQKISMAHTHSNIETLNSIIGLVGKSEGANQGEIFNSYENDVDAAQTGVYTKNVASGKHSHAEGCFNNANGAASHTEGCEVTALGNYSHAEGYNTTAKTYGVHVQGQHNAGQDGSASTFSATQDVFIIGCGASSSAVDNAFRVDFSGNVYGKSAFNSSGADYAEYFEWEDNNTNNEDRVGYFVTFGNNGKIKKATSSDEILGIVSSTAGVIGDSYEDTWNGMYQKDNFGRFIYEDVQVTYPKETSIIEHPDEFRIVFDTDENGKITGSHSELVKEAYSEEVILKEARTVTEKHIKLSENYDNTKQYIPRSRRREWGCVGTLGKIFVYDDGTCQVNQKCKCNENGIATLSNDNTGYRVIERVAENIVRVWFK